MNSEELELSLRNEFENHLKSVLTEMRQEVSEFQNKFEAEIERHREAMSEAFRAFSSRGETQPQFDEAFNASVTEHLRLARDEGARISAEAFAEAEKLEREKLAREELEKEPPPQPVYDRIRDAVKEISSQDSQSSILKTLVQHATELAPRGGFFIVKNEHLAGWRVFGGDEQAEDAVRDVHFPISADSLLGAAVRSQNTVESSAGEHSADGEFLDKVNFGRPEKMYAVPLIARGKAVAVLYADNGDGSGQLNVEALETIVRVAGLTVELQASAATPATAEAVEETREQTTFHEPAPAAHYEPAREASYSFEPSTSYEPSTGVPYEAPATAYEEVPAYEPEPVRAPEPVNGAAEGALVFESGGSIEGARYGDSPFEQRAPQQEFRSEPVAEPPYTAPEPQYTPEPQPTYTPAPEPQYAPVGQPEFAPAPMLEKNIEPVSPVVSSPMGRLSDRPVDLPIDVPEQERRLHNDARRFARLLVSEIKLYNEKKVSEGRQAHDLYDRLKEAIDRSREMYDKRVQPPVAAKFDYFHYELVNALADGNAERLGGGYPGPAN